jgi:hypothetical protein
VETTTDSQVMLSSVFLLTKTETEGRPILRRPLLRRSPSSKSPPASENSI